MYSAMCLILQTFNGKKWEKFNSEKVASLAYARIQGKSALVSHFQNSSLMNEDKRCRPILFHSEGSEVGDLVIGKHWLVHLLYFLHRKLKFETCRYLLPPFEDNVLFLFICHFKFHDISYYFYLSFILWICCLLEWNDDLGYY